MPPATLLHVATTSALLNEHMSKLAPRRMCAEGLIEDNSADAHLVPKRILMGRIAESSKAVWVLKVDLSDLCASPMLGSTFSASLVRACQSW